METEVSPNPNSVETQCTVSGWRREEWILADQNSTRVYPLSKVWSELTLGRAFVIDCFLTEKLCYAVLAPGARSPGSGRKLTSRRVQILERILLGEAQKAVALSLGIAPSTVTLSSAECLSAMGLECSTSRIPMLLTLAAHAHAYGAQHIVGRATTLFRHGTGLLLVSTPRPDEILDALTPAEREVARLLTESRPHLEIAGLRGTSARTIANQLAAAFHKLGVSGRSELLSRLCRAAVLSAQREEVGTLESTMEPPVSLRDLRAPSLQPHPAS